MTEPEKLFCPQCKEWKEKASFTLLPLDLRCQGCVALSSDQAMELYDKKVELAGQKISQLLDGVEHARSLKPLERMLDMFYDQYGGGHVFMGDVVTWIKQIADKPGGKGLSTAVAAAMKILQLHAKVDRMKIEEDWNQLSKEEIKTKLQLKMMAILAEAELPGVKKSAIKGLLGGND